MYMYMYMQDDSHIFRKWQACMYMYMYEKIVQPRPQDTKSCVTLKMWEWPGDETVNCTQNATQQAIYHKRDHSQYCCHNYAILHLEIYGAGKWVPEELRAFTKPKEDDKPYVPPAYYGEEEEQLDSSEDDDDEQNESSSSELDEISQPQDTSDCVAETQEHSSKVEEVDHSISSQEQSTTNETDVRNRIKEEDVVTIGNSDESVRDDHETASVATNFDEDVSTAGTANGSGVIFVSNSKDDSSSSWSRYQQKQLEWALVQYPKFAKERWESIAKAVPGKSKVRNYSWINKFFPATFRLSWGVFSLPGII